MSKSNHGQRANPFMMGRINYLCEGLFFKPGNELFGAAVVGLLTGIILFIVKLLMNCGRPLPEIWHEFTEKNSAVVAWICMASVTGFNFYLRRLQDHVRKRDAAISATQLENAKREKDLAVRQEREAAIAATQKEHIRILDRFPPPPKSTTEFSDERSIYNAIISTLTRLDLKKGCGKLGRYQVCLLLCSPALDHPDNPDKPGKPWGHEFEQLIKHLLTHENIYMDICYLPIEPMLGFNPMGDFLFVLANLISSAVPSEFSKNLSMLREQTERVAGDIEREAKRHERFKIWPSMLNVPFQIVLVSSENFNEVVVSFAGREILESGKNPKGFFSSDPYVVDTFQKIYWDYVKQEGRLPFVPPVTQKVIEAHELQSAHTVYKSGHSPFFEA